MMAKSNRKKKKSNALTDESRNSLQSPPKKKTKKTSVDDIQDDSQNNVNSEKDKTMTAISKGRKHLPVFRMFFPLKKNKKYPSKKGDKYSNLFVDSSLPSDPELNILKQMFNHNDLLHYKSLSNDNVGNKDLNHILFVKKHLRKLSNVYSNVEYFIIDEVIDADDDDSSSQLIKLSETEAVMRVVGYLNNKVSKNIIK